MFRLWLMVDRRSSSIKARNSPFLVILKFREYGFRPDFCEGADPESKGLVENLVGYVKSDLMVPEELTVSDLAGERQRPGLVQRGERRRAL